MNNNSSQSSLLKIWNVLNSVDFIPEGNSLGFNEICQQYKLDRISCYARIPNTDMFIQVDEGGYGKEHKQLAMENGFDFHKSLYQKDTNSKKEVLENMLNNPIIRTSDFEEYRKGLKEIGYIDGEKPVAQALICTMITREFGVVGYALIEQYKETLTHFETNFDEVLAAIEIIFLRIEKDEVSKQLAKEEQHTECDELTRLSQPHKFKEDATRALRIDENYVMFLLDIDKFKYINDIWSYTTGNSILLETAVVVKQFAGADGICCRMDADKFGILRKYSTEEELQQTIEELDKALIEVHQEKHHHIKITYICGVYVVKEDYFNINAIIDKANLARNSAKGSFNNTFELYNKSMENYSERERQLEGKTKSGLRNKEFVPFLQPKFTLGTTDICGAEALARWRTDERMIEPYEFIPIFEKNGFVTLLDFEIYEQTFKFIQHCMEAGYKLFPISLNVSRGHINDEDFLDKFTKLLDTYNVPRKYIELEITESIFAEDKERLKKFIYDIRNIGISVSIDDFGSAYSSLNMLKDIDVDVVKLDKSFIDNIGDLHTEEGIHKDKIIIQNIVNMITCLGFKTIFEGIETQEQVDFLQTTGCTLGQGYIFSRPTTLEDFEKRYFLGVDE